MTAVENRIHYVSNLVKEGDNDPKILVIEFKYFTTDDYNKFASQTLDAKIKQKALLTKSDISNLVKSINLDKNVATLATKEKSRELKPEQDQLTKLQAFNSSYLCGVILKMMVLKVV